MSCDDSNKVDFTLSVTLEHQSSLIHQRVNLEGNIIENFIATLAYIQVIDPVALRMYMYGTTGYQKDICAHSGEKRQSLISI